MSAGTVRVLLVIIILVGAALRFYGLYWGSPHSLHCDEAKIVGVADRLGKRLVTEHSLNPRFSAYGALPLYAMWLGAIPVRIVEAVLSRNWSMPQRLMLSGRTLSALADLFAIYLVFRLGALISPLAGLIAATLYAGALLNIREAHFSTVDSLGSALALLYVLLWATAGRDPQRRTWVRCGIALGLCLCVKVSFLPLALIALVAVGVAAFGGVRAGGDPRIFRLARAARQIRGAAAIMAALAFIPAALWHSQGPRIIALADDALMRRTPQAQLDAHSDEFWHDQVESVYYGVLHMLVLGGFIIVALGAALLVASHAGHGPRSAYELSIRIPGLLIFVGVAALTFVVLNPYCILSPAEYWMPAGPDYLTWNLLQAGGALHPPPGWTIQFIGTFPLIYQYAHVLPYGWGWPLMVLLTGAFIWAGRAIRRQEMGRLWVVWVAALAMLLGTLSLWMKMARYMVPLTPLLCVLAGAWLATMLSSGKRPLARLAAVVGAGTCLASLLWCAGYVAMYGQTDSRIAAAQWLGSHVKPGQTVALEKDDAWGNRGETMLARAGAFSVERFNPLQIMHDRLGSTFSQEDCEAKEKYLQEALAGADYLILTDNNHTRLARFRSEFPVITAFHSDLFGGSAGFTEAASFANTWKFLGHTVNDGGAEPTFRLFDHPKVYIFKRLQ